MSPMSILYTGECVFWGDGGLVGEFCGPSQKPKGALPLEIVEPGNLYKIPLEHSGY